MAPGVFEGPALGHSHPVLDLGECLLDGVEVWRVGRQVPQTGASCANGAADLDRFVAAQIVHDDDVPGANGVEQLLFDPGTEARTVNRPVENAWRDDPVTA
mgnify:CR=1 FL=1